MSEDSYQIHYGFTEDNQDAQATRLEPHAQYPSLLDHHNGFRSIELSYYLPFIGNHITTFQNQAPDNTSHFSSPLREGTPQASSFLNHQRDSRAALNVQVHESVHPIVPIIIPGSDKGQSGTSKRFKCTSCDVEFGTLGNAKRHQEKERKIYACRYCQRHYSRKDYTRAHEKKCRFQRTSFEPLDGAPTASTQA